MAPARSSGPRRPETLLQQSAEPVFLLSPSGRLLYVNPAWEELTGASWAELSQRDSDPAPGGGVSESGTNGELLESFRPPPEAIAGSPASTTTLIRRADGLRLWRRLEFWPHRDRAGRPLFLLGVARPVDDAPTAPESPAMRLRADLWRLRERLIDRIDSDALVGRGPAHRRLLEQIEAASAVSQPILIVGPPGSGKRQVAWAIHRRAGPPDAPLVAIDCEALPPEFLERELFGLPGPEGRGQSPIRLSGRAGGSLVLGDLLALPRDLQRLLVEALRAEDRPAPRLLVTTSGDPEEALRDDRLIPELYFALTTLTIRLAPLRERLEELPLLAQDLLERANRRRMTRRLGFRPEAIEVLLRYDWPGNLDELARVVDLAIDRSSGDLIGPDDLPATIRGHLGSAYLPPAVPEERLPLDETLERVERRLIEGALKTARGNKSLAAKILHVSRTRLHRRIQELGLSGDPDAEPSDLDASADASPD
ncbi:sigma 54-interacting transcriptional regulator [Tautonia sociabilis]|uniref:PAS domain-containing protein n=1 Tax=Tautonia sociabilis TaxID=2080755 RepID=A0A432MQ45_9BACT|nr:sigma 54-interacting transcriptional regulator [Tautonia sociabilis]RUL89267.1 PAS domain-containing protein [Tautonia sociabilis]